MTRKSPEKGIFTFSGALSRGNDWLVEYEDEAIDYYDNIRNMNDREYDEYVSIIAYNADRSWSEINTMLHHLCFNEYDLEDGRYERFDEDPYIMFSLKRLYNGTFYEADQILIDHENMEYHYVHDDNMTCHDAHMATIRDYDYNVALLAVADPYSE